MCALAESHKGIDLGKSAGETVRQGQPLAEENKYFARWARCRDPPASSIFQHIVQLFVVLFFASHLHKHIALAERWLVE